MTTLDIEIALLKECKFIHNLVVPNVSWCINRCLDESLPVVKRKFDVLHECDILKVTTTGYATEYEIKISKSDFKADAKKKHSHDSRFIKQLYYVVPVEMKQFAIDNLPSNAGLAIVRGDNVQYVIEAPIRKNCFKWTEKEMFKLAKLGATRIYNLKKNVQKLKQSQHEQSNRINIGV